MEVVNMSDNLGVITEQGDLGLGFKPLTEEEKKKIKENDLKGNSNSEDK